MLPENIIKYIIELTSGKNITDFAKYSTKVVEKSSVVTTPQFEFGSIYNSS
jgi:hypothetical protein